MKLLKITLGCIAGLAIAAAGWAQNYSVKPVRMIVPYPAGQGTDVAARHFADQK